MRGVRAWRSTWASTAGAALQVAGTRVIHRLADQAMVQASATALTRLATAVHCLGTARPGCSGVRHPWGRQRPSPPPIPLSGVGFFVSANFSMRCVFVGVSQFIKDHLNEIKWL